MRRRPTIMRGQSVVELALLMPLFALLLIGALDLGRVFFAYNRLTNTVREGALYGAYRPYNSASGSTIDVRTRAYNEANGKLGTSGSDVVVTVTCSRAPGDCSTAVGGDTITVRGTYAFKPITGQLIRFWGTTFTIRKSTTMVIVSG